jgi:radical SAM superfamily enzyme YgiQ (UPF0313 family)
MPGGAQASVVFAMPPGGVTPTFSEHLGTAFLRTVLARGGIGSLQYLPERGVSLRAFAAFLRERRPAVVGLTAYESNLRACRALAGVARETLPEAVVAVGGPNATFSPEETLELLGADVCLRGAGESTIAPFVAAILGSERPRRQLPELLAPVRNLAVRAPGGVVHTPLGDLSSFPGEPFRTLDDIPSPYRAGMITTPDAGVLTARGCNQHCTYCSFAAISARRVHHHGVERVLDDLAASKEIFDRSPRRARANVLVLDDAFTLSPERARRICEGIVARRLQLPLECETRADRVDADLLRLMREAGFVEISFGLESAVPRVLRAIGKVQDPATRDDPGHEAERAYLEACRRAVRLAEEAGLTPSVSVIGGLPGEREEDFRETLAFVASLPVRWYAHNVLALMPGTPLHEDRRRHGLDAGRDPVTRAWRTVHAFDAQAVTPLPNAVDWLSVREEAHEIADALCGRPRAARAGDASAWAAVLHGRPPAPEDARWLREVLAVHGAVVVLEGDAAGGHVREGWARALDEAEVPAGTLAVLTPEDASAERSALRAWGTSRPHRFELHARWPAGAAVESAGPHGARVPLCILSEDVLPPEEAPESDVDHVPQVADACRWWSGWRRCSRPRVLHVRADGTVRPCWNGPAIGEVGDAYEDLAARGRALAAPGGGSGERCPLGGGDAERARAAEAWEVASQLWWAIEAEQASR